MLAAWSLAIEGEQPGPLAQASRQLGRSAERPAYQRSPAGRRRPRSSLLASALLAGAQPDSAAGWYLLGRQMAMLGHDLVQLHQTRGQLQRAEELEAGLRAALSTVRAETTATPPAAIAPEDRQVTTEHQRLSDATRPSSRNAASDDENDAQASRRLNDVTRRKPRRGR